MKVRVESALSQGENRGLSIAPPPAQVDRKGQPYYTRTERQTVYSKGWGLPPPWERRETRPLIPFLSSFT
ncbi:MAG: hypothetical protein E6I80_17635 [Chloroflexi bacterium]|nr:MAG: hypothetical protein E6I80_17635 [Chloroflexota bacterium]